MRILLVPLLGILAFTGTACEQHSADALPGSHGKPGAPEKVEPSPAPAIPPNPAGSGPVGEYEAVKPNPPESGTPPKFFPKK